MNAPDFQHFQHAFADYLRDPQGKGRPAAVPARRGVVYRELVFNNLAGFLDACFPVARQLLGEPRWRRLQRRFLRDWPLHTPWFREIPHEFVRYLNSDQRPPRLPRWLPELAHYEWIELAVDIMETAKTDFQPLDAQLLDRRLILNPTLQRLHYTWPVHRIGTEYRPRRPQPCVLAVYRDDQEQVRFSELNPLTDRLLALLADGLSARQAIPVLAAENSLALTEQLLAFARTLLDELVEQQIIAGVAP